jgi:hypothetical protein
LNATAPFAVNLAPPLRPGGAVMQGVMVLGSRGPPWQCGSLSGQSGQEKGAKSEELPTTVG